MRKTIIAALAALVVGGAAYAAAPMNPNVTCGPNCIVEQEHAAFDAPEFQGRSDFDVVQVQATTSTTTQTRTPTEPAQVTTTVKGGSLLADVVQWFWLAFGTVVTGGIMMLVTKVFTYFGVQTTSEQRAQLQTVVVNGLNSAAARAQTSLRNNEKLDVTMKGQIVSEAVAYTQAHAAETIKALGLDPQSGDAVQVIKARIETALNDPTTPTPPAITPPTGLPNQPLAPKIA